MAINAMIPLQAQAGDPLNALAQGYQLGNTIRQQPMVDQMNQQKLDAGKIELDSAKLKQQEFVQGMAKTSLQADYYGAVQIAPYLASGDMESVTKTIEQRKQAKKLIGMPTDTEDNFLAELQSNPEQAKKSVAGMLSIGERLFGKSQSSRPVALNPGGQLYGPDGTLWAENQNQRGGTGGDLYGNVIWKQGPNNVLTPVQLGKNQQIPQLGPGERWVATPSTMMKPEIETLMTPIKEQQAEATARGKEVGKYQGETATGAGQAKQKANMMISQIDNVLKTTYDVLENADWSTTGATGVVASKIPGSDAYDLRKNIETIKANLGFDRLQQMRDASPTGGALGQVAVQELEGLQASLASLDPAQSAPQLRANLRKIAMHYSSWKEAVQDSYQQRYEQPNGPVPPVPGQPATKANMKPMQGVSQPQSQAEYDALPSGAIFIDPDDGKQYRKP